jgi:hypothetical protein
VTTDDRTGSAPNLSPSVAPPAGARADTQTASFEVAQFRLELTAATGAARLVVVHTGARDIYVVEPTTLANWARSLERLLALTPATGPYQRAEYRSPFLIDREGRASIAFEALVSETGVSFRLMVQEAESRVVGVVTTDGTVREVAEAATGVVSVARGSGTGRT